MEVIANDYLFVDFAKYCGSCKHGGKKEKEEPCNSCLDNPTNLHSSKPIRWEKK